MVALTDESSLTLRLLKRSVSSSMEHTFKSGYVPLSVWGPFSVHKRSPLVRICGKLNQSKYIEIFKQFVIPFMQNFRHESKEFLYQNNECGLHRDKSLAGFQYAEKADVHPWPSQNPEINPIEN